MKNNPVFCFLAIGILCLQNIQAQKRNLVPNPGFEEVQSLMTTFAKAPKDIENAVEHWFVPNLTTPDLISPDFTTDQLTVGVPREGNNHIGLVSGDFTFTEYVGVKLLKTLQPNKQYKGSFWLKLAESKGKVLHFNHQILNRHFGLLFGQKIQNYNGDIIKANPQVNVGSNQIIVNTNNWTKIESYFELEEAADYIYIGQFMAPKKPPHILNGSILVDMIEVIEIENSLALPDQLTIGNSHSLQHIYFRTGSAELLPHSDKALEELFGILEQNPTLSIEIIGHTDETGTDKLNLTLSIQRSKAVYDYLLGRGVQKERLFYYGVGDKIPLVKNDSQQGRKLNRRVEFVLLNNEKLKTPSFQDVYRFSEDILKDGQNRDWELTFIGAYEAGKKQAEGEQKLPEQLSTLSEAIKQHQIEGKDARETILQSAKTHQVVMINEAHQIPQHRSFMHSMLKGFYEMGFRYIGMELLHNQELLEKEGYPTIGIGINTREPILADLIRYSQNLGFQLFSYESTTHQGEYLKKTFQQKGNSSEEEIIILDPNGGSEFTHEDFNISMNARDLAQALNVQKILAEDPNAKMLIFAGFAHVAEKEKAGWLPLAYQLKQLTGIDPLTIDQNGLNVPESTASAFYAKHQTDKPTIFFNKDNTPYLTKEFDPFSEEQYVSYYHLQVLHPPLTAKDNNWLLMDGYRSPYPIDISHKKINCPCLIQAYKAEERIKNAVPVAVIEIKEKKKTQLMLPKGNYRLLFRNKNNQNFIEKISIE